MRFVLFLSLVIGLLPAAVFIVPAMLAGFVWRCLAAGFDRGAHHFYAYRRRMVELSDSIAREEEARRVRKFMNQRYGYRK